MTNPINPSRASGGSRVEQGPAEADARAAQSGGSAREATPVRREASREDGADPLAPAHLAETDRLFGTGRAASRAGVVAPSHTGGPAPQDQSGVPTKLTSEDVAALRASGFTVTSADGGRYIINAPYSSARDLVIRDGSALSSRTRNEGASRLSDERAKRTTLGRVDNPSGGVADPIRDAGVPSEIGRTGKAAGGWVTTGLGDEVDVIVNRSTTLQRHLGELKSGGWTLAFGKVGIGGTGVDEKGKPVILIDPSLAGQPEKTASVVAHEVGHARHPVVTVSPLSLSKAAFTQHAVEMHLDGEGAAVLENLRASHEGKLEIAGFQPDERYERVYFEHLAGLLDESATIRRLGQIYGDGELHGETGVTYRDHYTQVAQRGWEDARPKR
jgi:hypothetical protein